MDKLYLLNMITKTARDKGMTLSDLTEKIGLKKNALYSFKNSAPSIEKVLKIAEVLDVSIDYLVGRTDEPNVNTKLNREAVMEAIITDDKFQQLIDNAVQSKIQELLGRVFSNKENEAENGKF